MNKKLRLSLALLSCFVVVGSITLYATGYVPEFLKTEKVLVVQVPPVPIEEPFVLKPYNFPYPAVDSSDWQTVNLKTQGISFKIPKDWILRGCGLGLKSYGLSVCEEGEYNRDLSLSLGPKRIFRGNGETRFFSIEIDNSKYDLERIIKLNRPYIGHTFPNDIYRTMTGIFQILFDGRQAVLIVQRLDMPKNPSLPEGAIVDYFHVEMDFNGKNLMFSGADGPDGTPVKFGMTKAFLDSIRFTN